MITHHGLTVRACVGWTSRGSLRWNPLFTMSPAPALSVCPASTVAAHPENLRNSTLSFLGALMNQPERAIYAEWNGTSETASSTATRTHTAEKYQNPTRDAHPPSNNHPSAQEVRVVRVNAASLASCTKQTSQRVLIRRRGKACSNLFETDRLAAVGSSCSVLPQPVSKFRSYR